MYIEMNNIYWEPQRGGLCRLHSINAYFGQPMYTEDMFNLAADEFDAIQRDKYGPVTSCRIFDAIHSDQRNLVSYILGNHGVYVRNVAYTSIKQHYADALASSCFFVFNLDHIWIVKKHEDVWYKVDSMGGVKHININILHNEKNMGIMIPIINLQGEYNRLAALMKIDIAGDITTFLTVNHAAKKILGDVEVYMGAMVEILKIQRGDNPEFTPVNLLITRYGTFIRELCAGTQYNNISFLMCNVPPIIHGILEIADMPHPPEKK
jgi:hypothetical protein